MTTDLSQSDLSLTALCYLAGELDAAGTDAFERLLGADEAAQQALVRAVQISAAVQSGASAPALVPSVRIAAERRPERASRWSTAAALIGSGLVAATVLVALRDAPESESVVSTSDESRPGATVSLWSELNVEEIEASLDEPSLMTLDGAAADAVQVPDWMFAAVDTDFAADHDPGSPPAPEATDEDLLEYRL